MFTGNIWSPAISSGVNNNQFVLATSDHINSGTTSAKSIDNSITLNNVDIILPKTLDEPVLYAKEIIDLVMQDSSIALLSDISDTMESLHH